MYVLVVLCLELCSAQSPDEPCVTNAYPPDPRYKPITREQYSLFMPGYNIMLNVS